VEISATDFKKLRQRLGWSVAEMARQMGCSVDIVVSWEAGTQAPDNEVINQMRYLQTYVESYNDKIAQLPMAEREMEAKALSQLTHQDFSSKNSN
jgi:ribosome-binding protein aMBF1 (putative translation factor)